MSFFHLNLKKISVTFLLMVFRHSHLLNTIKLKCMSVKSECCIPYYYIYFLLFVSQLRSPQQREENIVARKPNPPCHHCEGKPEYPGEKIAG